MNEAFVIHPEVASALENRHPVVALESTVITHGLPYPQNVETAVSMETAVRQSGAIPATIAIIQGQVHVGLTSEQLRYLGKRDSTLVRKCSRKDLAIAMALGQDGATTVAGTMIVAQAVGIAVFATGGIGGVHRGHPFDISADLTELGRTPVVVVCSGAKSILDLPATREVLETNGVPIIGYGVEALPAFFSKSSGLPVDICLETAAEVAAVIMAHRRCGLQSGLVVGVPVPEALAFDADEAEAAIQQATQEADAQGIYGGAATPWLLARMATLTNGRSLQANVALLQNNGRVAGLIAKELVQKATSRK